MIFLNMLSSIAHEFIKMSYVLPSTALSTRVILLFSTLIIATASPRAIHHQLITVNKITRRIFEFNPDVKMAIEG
jgi:hypothetical protein